MSHAATPLTNGLFVAGGVDTCPTVVHADKPETDVPFHIPEEESTARDRVMLSCYAHLTSSA